MSGWSPPPLLGQLVMELAFSGRGTAESGYPAAKGSAEPVCVMQY